MTRKHETFRSRILWGVLTGVIVVVGLVFGPYRPDRPVATIVPGSSQEPSFIVQVIRPRLGLPLGGILPPSLFGQEEKLVFSSGDAAAAIAAVRPGRIELSAEDWELVLAFDSQGRVAPETQVVFEFVFEDSLRKVRGRPGEPAVGVLNLSSPTGPGEISGDFDVELPICEDAATGKDLGWPPRPLVLHGSFDRLRLETSPDDR
jgi:hypothetical protein